MKSSFFALNEIRGLYKKRFFNLSDEEWLTVPSEYSNNLLWNIGHVTLVQQNLMYAKSGLEMKVPSDWIGLFGPNTSPKDWKSNPSIDEIKELCSTVYLETLNDFEKGLFKNYSPYTTKSNVTLSHAEDAAAFINFHEGLHWGIAHRLVKEIQK